MKIVHKIILVRLVWAISSLIFFGIFLTLFITESSAQEITEIEDPIDYQIGLQLMNIGTIDRQSGSYDLIFWITIVTDDLDLTEFPPPDEWDFTNGYITDVTGTNTDPHFHKFKVRGVFYNQVDFRDYPFETLDLAVHIEPYFPLTSDKMIFTVNPDYSGIAGVDTVSVPGWDVGTPSFGTYVEEYPWGYFTHFVANFPVETSPFTAFMKKIFPVVILVSFAYSTFWMSPKNISDRIAIISAALVSAIFFHAVFLLGELPPLGYLTIADMIMMVAYGLFLLCLLQILLHRHFYEISKKEYTPEKARHMDRKMRMIIPVILVGIFFSVYWL